MIIAARSRLKRKIVEEGWSRGVTSEWVEMISSLKKKWCNRYDGLSIRMMTSGLPGGVPDICSDVPNAVLKETLLPQGIQLLPYVNDVSKLIRLPQ